MLWNVCSLPGQQAQLIQDVAHSVPKGTPVVLYILACGPVNITWATESDRVHAVVQGFYPAQSTGDAMADILFGNISPAGRLPVTWPRSMDQVPAMQDYSMTGRTYRYWNTSSPALYPFGYGLSYTLWKYIGLELSSPHQVSVCSSITGRVTVVNVGAVVADEVVQVYATAWSAAMPGPQLQLVAFDRVSGVEPGQSVTVSFTITPSQLSYYANVTPIAPAGHPTGGFYETLNGSVILYAGGQQPDLNDRPGMRRVPSNILKQQVAVVGARVPLASC